MSARDDYPIADPVGPGPSAYYDDMCDEIDQLRAEKVAVMAALDAVGTAYHNIAAALDSIADKQVPTVLRQFRRNGTSS